MVNFSKSVTGKQKIDTGKKNTALEPNLLIREWESIAILRGLAKHITEFSLKKILPFVWWGIGGVRA